MSHPAGVMRDVLVVTGGHRVDLGALLGMVEDLSFERCWRWAHAKQPRAQAWMVPPLRWDAILLHDLNGLELHRGRAPRPIEPAPDVLTDMNALMEAGQGLVVLHHAMASWPAWDGWANAIGGRFLYTPGTMRGVEWPSSGTRAARYTAQPVAPDHPVCIGVDSFELDDELYLCPVFEDEVEPLVRADASMDPELFISTFAHVVVGEEQAPTCTGHPTGTNLVAWATSAARSPIVVIQPGDNAATFAVPQFRRLIANALDWVASSEARAWACDRRGSPAHVQGVSS